MVDVDLARGERFTYPEAVSTISANPPGVQVSSFKQRHERSILVRSERKRHRRQRTVAVGVTVERTAAAANS